MSVPSGGPPHETALRTATAGDSVVPVRHVLGTVPVEADGSAISSSRPTGRCSSRRSTSTGWPSSRCARPRTCTRASTWSARAATSRSIAAASRWRRCPWRCREPPSRLKPDVDGTAPFSYPRLVQPVLDKHCVECHAKNAGKAMNLAREPIVGRWYASYNNLVRDYGFHDYGDPYRTTPGHFGARASKLYEVLQKGHYGVKLSAGRHAPPHAMAGLLVDVLRRLRAGRGRGPAPRRSGPADARVVPSRVADGPECRFTARL